MDVEARKGGSGFCLMLMGFGIGKRENKGSKAGSTMYGKPGKFGIPLLLTLFFWMRARSGSGCKTRDPDAVTPETVYVLSGTNTEQAFLLGETKDREGGADQRGLHETRTRTLAGGQSHTWFVSHWHFYGKRDLEDLSCGRELERFHSGKRGISVPSDRHAPRWSVPLAFQSIIPHRFQQVQTLHLLLGSSFSLYSLPAHPSSPLSARRPTDTAETVLLSHGRSQFW